jgi:hypothetical protein
MPMSRLILWRGSRKEETRRKKELIITLKETNSSKRKDTQDDLCRTEEPGTENKQRETHIDRERTDKK